MQILIPASNNVITDLSTFDDQCWGLCFAAVDEFLAMRLASGRGLLAPTKTRAPLALTDPYY